ncbi:hypothetical protein PMAYCL1PPCAC_05893 [Pristionchus mayeri]|uniref:Uncharacterized protein n=1 Tax=Pristionchus mayeri TaxID=1317129 RepID=A0AAN4ZAW4_9BILA|nr:hypothetical protein PMAYCL1PPCAC_05891 [Pristionchus mayeri]GMR35698.1 hypothetical protein PMAYCL1PPCAC_05893 [Pristionchus mayeri]
MPSTEDLNILNLPHDIVRTIMQVGQEKIDSMKLLVEVCKKFGRDSLGNLTNLKKRFARCSRIEEIRLYLDEIKMNEELRTVLNGLVVNRLIFNYIRSSEEESAIINLIRVVRDGCICFRTCNVWNSTKEFDKHFPTILRFLNMVPAVEIIHEQSFSVSCRRTQLDMDNRRRGYTKEFEDKLNSTGKVTVVFSEDPLGPYGATSFHLTITTK